MTTTTPDLARWRSAVDRALSDQIKVVQVGSTGQWIATSGSQPGVAYALEVTGNVCTACDCLAGQHGDGVCKHRAAFYLLIGALHAAPPAEDLLLSEITAGV